MIITINNLERNTADDTVITAHWTARLEEVTVTDAYTVPSYTDEQGVEMPAIEVPESTTVDYSASAYGSQSFTRDDESAEFIPFADLTEADVIGWLTLDEGLEANLQAQIDEQKTPSTVSGTPWQEEVTEAV
jgi:hypothetical protein